MDNQSQMTRRYESFRRDELPGWKGKYMNRVTDSSRRELKALAAKANRDIDFSDIPATAALDWTDAVRGKHFRPIKLQVTSRIDSHVLERLKSQGK